jgi:site-specific DNA-cytosine methylase
MSGLHCPIVDLNSRRLLSDFQGRTVTKLVASYKMLRVSPSVRSFHILRQRERERALSAIGYFAGGSTLTRAITDDPRFKLVGAVEISPKFASHFVMEHPEVPLYQCDIRDLDPSELPSAAFMFASLPCACFSTTGAAKNRLKGTNELGDTGDLFLSFAHHVAKQMPLAVMVENVPAFFGCSAIAGRVLMAHLERLGYHVHYFQVDPWDEWVEPQDRKRGVLVATLFWRFYPAIPMTPFLGTVEDYLHAPDPIRDREAAERIKNRMAGRARHLARHRAAGNGFGFSVIDHPSRKVPTICPAISADPVGNGCPRRQNHSGARGRGRQTPAAGNDEASGVSGVGEKAAAAAAQELT